MLEKKEQYLNKKIVEEQNKAKAMVSTNKRGTSIFTTLRPWIDLLILPFCLHRGSSSASTEESVRE